MQSTQLSQSQETVLNALLNKSPKLQPLIARIAQAGGKAFLVGGAVRDLLLGLSVKDLDIEVHGLELKELEAILSEYGSVSVVGKSFGVLRLHGLDIDWSLPRRDEGGRKPRVAVDPHMSIKEACARRDLTMNAMAIDLQSRALYDPFDGKKDLEDKVLRATDPQFFVEDPLRFYRVMQFISRFDMQPDTELNALCKAMNISTVSRERIEMEFDKMLLKSERPSLGIRWLREINRLKDVLPELYITIGIQQDPRWHPEGDVFEHTMQVLDAAARTEYLEYEQRIVLLLAALCHDLGKVDTTKKQDGKITSYGHDVQGVPITKSMLARITRKKDRIATVAKLVRYHMMPLQLVANDAKVAAYRRLALKISPQTNMRMLAELSCADRCGRNAESALPLQPDGACDQVRTFIKKAQEAKVYEAKQAPIVQGRDLAEFVEPGPKMGELIKRAYDIQIEEGIEDKQKLIKKVLNIR